MKTLDNTIRYHELLMSYEDTSICPNIKLPSGYCFEFYQNDEEDWIQIHLESKEFTSIAEGKKIFQDFYGHFFNELSQRCIFIVEESTGEKVGTATISYLKDKQFGYDAVMDWFAIKKSHQGKHLAKAMLTRMICLAHELNHTGLLLHTQTTTPVAAKIYLDLGFVPLNKDDKIGWRILKTLTDHEKLKEFDAIESDQIYDLRNIEIERQLTEIYKPFDFNYSVWYKNGLHHVDSYCNDISHRHEYFETQNGISLKQIK